MEGVDRNFSAIGPSVVDDPLLQDRRGNLSRHALKAITDKLVPRLAGYLPDQEQGRSLAAPSDAEIDRFCDALTASDAMLSSGFCTRVQSLGLSSELLCLDYIAPAAQRLGTRWLEDRCSFLEVTLGAARLHGLLRTLDRDLMAPPNRAMHGYTALFSAVPGETHLLGITMAAGFFRRAGWVVDLNTSDDPDTLFACAEANAYGLIGLSAGSDAGSTLLDDTIRRLRAAQPRAVICLGGHLTEIAPRRVEQVGADLIMQDITTAPFFLQKMVSNALSH